MYKKSLKNQIVEKRLSPRTRLQSRVKVVREKEINEEQMDNYSLTGLFFKCNLPDQYDLDESIEIRFKTVEGVDQTRTGRVVRKTEQGIAIQYHKK